MLKFQFQPRVRDGLIKQRADQLGKVANPARGQLNEENNIFPVPVSRDGFGRPVPRQPSHSPHSQAESGAAYSREIPPAFGGGVHLLIIPATAIGSVPSLSGHAIAYGWRSLRIVRRHRASSSQGSSSDGCCLFFRCHHGPN